MNRRKGYFALYTKLFVVNIGNAQVLLIICWHHEDLICLILTCSDVAAKVMIELLSTYTDENASLAKKDARNCIVTALADPNMFLLDPLLSLKPISFLKGDLVYELLNIFIKEKYSKYVSFYQANKDFVSGLGNLYNTG